MNFFFLAAALNCPATIIENRSTDPWNKFDEWTLSTAKKRCPKLYVKSPCLKKLVKLTARDYHAICGRDDGSRERSINYQR